jgi:hypothetical protein
VTNQGDVPDTALLVVGSTGAMTYAGGGWVGFGVAGGWAVLLGFRWVMYRLQLRREELELQQFRRWEASWRALMTQPTATL